MTQLQWQRAREITADAFDRDPADRDGFVQGACAGDAEVLQEVLRLLRHDENSSPGFLSVPLVDLRALLTPPPAPPAGFRPGQELRGRFRIDRFVGSGGMGEVYAAMDLELQESVALKTIRPEIASLPSVIERFKREVKESRRITHPSVCRVYDLFSHGDAAGETIWFLTMELLDGQSLHDALAVRGPLSPAEAVPLIEDIVSAVSAAHAMGIVHRDLKPRNIMLVGQGSDRERAVVTDFGLALNVSPAGAAGQPPAGDGTPAYMSPEQAAGKHVGLEADQYALGLIVCEMLTGSRPSLSRESEKEARKQLKSWLDGQPRRIDRRLRCVIRRCLEFRAERRFRRAGDILSVLKGDRRRVALGWGVAAALCAGAALLAYSVPGLQVKEAVRITPESGLSSAGAISRDGKWVAYSSDRGQPGNLDIWIQSTSTGRPKRLTTHPAMDIEAAVSPDGGLVAFRSERDGGGLYVVNADGSGEQLLARGGWSPAFSPDGRSIAYWTGTRDDHAPSARLFVISSAGGVPRRLAADFADARYPVWSPDGRLLLFDGCKEYASPLSGCADWWMMGANGESPRASGALALLKARKMDLTTPPQKAWRDDRIIFSAARGSMVALWAQRVSAERGRVIGTPSNITPGEAGEREPAIAADGSIVFGRVTAALHVWRIGLQATPRATGPVTDEPEFDGCPGVSRDGRWLYFTRKLSGVRQLLARELAASRESIVYASNENKFWPIASADGSRVVFEVRQDSASSLWLMERGGAPRKLCEGCSHPAAWVDGESAVLYTTARGEIAAWNVTTGESRVVLAPRDGMVLYGADWSPGNGYLLFTAGRPGEKKQIFAARFPNWRAEVAEPWKRLSDDLADVDQPRWSADGQAFYFFASYDASNCVWGRSFAPSAATAGPPFPVMHYHDLRVAPDRATPLIRGLTVARDAIYLSVGEVSDTLWLGKLSEPALHRLFRGLFF